MFSLWRNSLAWQSHHLPATFYRSEKFHTDSKFEIYMDEFTHSDNGGTEHVKECLQHSNGNEMYL